MPAVSQTYRQRAALCSVRVWSCTAASQQHLSIVSITVGHQQPRHRHRIHASPHSVWTGGITASQPPLNAESAQSAGRANPSHHSGHPQHQNQQSQQPVNTALATRRWKAGLRRGRRRERREDGRGWLRAEKDGRESERRRQDGRRAGRRGVEGRGGAQQPRPAQHCSAAALLLGLVCLVEVYVVSRCSLLSSGASRLRLGQLHGDVLEHGLHVLARLG